MPMRYPESQHPAMIYSSEMPTSYPESQYASQTPAYPESQYASQTSAFPPYYPGGPVFAVGHGMSMRSPHSHSQQSWDYHGQTASPAAFTGGPEYNMPIASQSDSWNSSWLTTSQDANGPAHAYQGNSPHEGDSGGIGANGAAPHAYQERFVDEPAAASYHQYNSPHGEYPGGFDASKYA
jgi:hypothetical protein